MKRDLTKYKENYKAYCATTGQVPSQKLMRLEMQGRLQKARMCLIKTLVLRTDLSR